MSNLEHLIENAVIAIEEGTEFADFRNDERTQELFASTDIFLCDIWEIAQYAATTLKQDWKAKWDEENIAPTGEWIEDEYGFFSCSNCKFEPDSPEEKYPFCPMCGRKMSNYAKKELSLSTCNIHDDPNDTHDPQGTFAVEHIKTHQCETSRNYSENTGSFNGDRDIQDFEKDQMV